MNGLVIAGRVNALQQQEEIKVGAPASKTQKKIDAQVWIVGLISEETLLHKVVIVKNRDHNTMQELFARYCEPDTVIFTDGFAAYKAVNW